MTLEKGVLLLLAVVTIVMGFASVQMFGTQGRIDALYSDVGDIKADVAKVVTATEFMREDLAEIKVALQGIDKKLASAAPTGLKAPARFIVRDVPSFGAFLTTMPIMTGLSIGTEKPAQAEMLKLLYRDWLGNRPAAKKVPK